MKRRETPLPGVVLLEPRTFHDDRGSFFESWSADRYADAGVPNRFVQDNISRSKRGALRGLHLQHPHGQGKLVYTVAGEVFDVAVDVRVGSPTFGRWHAETLSADNPRQLYIPPGFAHGFCVTSDTAVFAYKCTDLYYPEDELTVAWNDPAIGIQWPVDEPLLSNKDRSAPSLDALGDRLPRCDE